MRVRLSQYAHVLPIAPGRALALHALTGVRLNIDDEVAAILRWFAPSREMPEELADLPVRQDEAVLAGCLAALMERGFLTTDLPEEEERARGAELSELHGRDPGSALDALRRRSKEGADPYWSVGEALDAAALAAPGGDGLRLDLLLFGDCELQMEAEFLRTEGKRRGLDVRVATGFPDDLRLAAERPHDAILVGALRSRREVALAAAEAEGGVDPISFYLAQARGVLEGLRGVSAQPILIDGLPEPTVQPLGMAERGRDGHRNRFRRLNLALEALAGEFSDVHLVDIAAQLNAHGSARLLDDGLVGFTHFGSPGWMLQRPARERAAVHGITPDPGPLEALVEGDPYRRERITAAAHLDALTTLKAIDRKKCVILDLDGTLWPGVLAETGAPFAWTPEVSGIASHIGLWFGLHEALLQLKRRGVLLACVSKNDEAVVRALWRYGEGYPTERLLTPDDFVTWRVNWEDKPSNIVSIAEELGFAPSAFLFIDDHPVERERVRAALPAVETWGEDLYGLRRRLLTDPRLQVARLTHEAADRTGLTRAQLGRERERVASGEAFLPSLELEVRVERAGGDAPFARVEELFARTTQFNTTGRRFTAGELERAAKGGALWIAHARDRFGDYGLVAAAVVEAGVISGLVMSCRVIGLGVERALLDSVLENEELVAAPLVETERNGPVRNLYADRGFVRDGDGLWRRPAPRGAAG